MKHHAFISNGRWAIATSIVLVGLFALGLALGIWLQPWLTHSDAASTDGQVAQHAVESSKPSGEMMEESEPEHVELTPQAAKNISLKFGPLEYGDYWKSLLVPARVVEVPGRSNLSVSAPVDGVVETVGIVPGQALERDSELMVVRITDDELTATQTRLLETITQQAIAEQELERIAPLVSSGAVSGNVKREQEYELRELEARRSTLVQELRGRGMPEAMIDSVLQQRKLLTRVTIRAPEFVGREASPAGTMSTGYSIENLYVHPGMSVGKGTELCSVAFHTQLYVEATAFEADLPVLERISQRGWKLLAETHVAGEHAEHEHADFAQPSGLDLLRVDNHVDEESQTVRFYVELENSITRIEQNEGRFFEQWKYRPGQRLHLRLPVERWQRQFVLPIDAVAIDGINAYVFCKRPSVAERTEVHDAPDGVSPTARQTSLTAGERPAAEVGDEADAEPDEIFDVYPIPVNVRYRDDRSVVIADNGQLAAGDPVALNGAYKLYLAWKMKAGGGHDHHHDH